MRQWARRTAALHGELAELAQLRGPSWWLLAGGAALPWQSRTAYVASDAEPAGDTFIGHPAELPADRWTDALVRAHAARAALRELDGELPDQPLAVTISRGHAATAAPSRLDVVAFASGGRIYMHRLAARITDEPGQLVPGDDVPFATVALDDEPLETARHGHRRAWRRNGVEEGPWLGLGYGGGLALVSTCHMIVDGYGHAWLAARIAEHARMSPRPRFVVGGAGTPASTFDAMPLAIGWRRAQVPGAIRLAYALGCVLHRLGDRTAPFSPTFQIPVAPGAKDDPLRPRRRVIPALASVRFDAGRPEPYEAFAARTRDRLAREASGNGLVSQLLAAAQSMPAPLVWKRRAVGPDRPRWLASVADVIGGRGCVSKIHIDVPPSVAVSSPARLATNADDLGGCVVTAIGDTITWCGSGRAGDPALLDELLALVGQ